MRQWFASRWRLCRRSALQGMATQFNSNGLAVLARPLIIAPHPDDEIFGCGGLIARILAENGRVNVIVLTGGEKSHDGCCDIESEAVKLARRQLAMKAAERLSLSKDSFMFLNWVDGRLAGCNHDETGRKVEELAALIGRLRPEAVFAPHPFEGWSDHEAAERITRAAIKQSGVPCGLFHYCVWFWFSMPLRKALRIYWSRARLLDIADVYEKKQAAIDAYLKPCAPCGNPWSGVLPRDFIKAFRWKKELFFEAEDGADGVGEGQVHIQEKVSSR